MSNATILDRLTLGEIAKIEELSGQSVSALADDDKPKGRLFIAIAYIVKRRSNPAFTLNEAEAIPATELAQIMGADSDPELPSA